MTATYNPALTSARDQVRFYLGDTVVASALISDEEIAAILPLASNDPLLAAATIADGLAARFTRSVNFSVEGLSISNSVKAENFRKLADSLRTRIRAKTLNSIGTPVIGGLSRDAIYAVLDNYDSTGSKFTTLEPRSLPPELGGE